MKNILFGILIFSCLTICAEDNINSGQDYKTYKILESIIKEIISWANITSKFDESLRKTVIESDYDIASSFTSAKFAWLINEPSKAIDILNKVISKHGNELYPYSDKLVKNKGLFWISTILRHFGDISNIEKLFEDIQTGIEKKNDRVFYSIIINLYLSELDIKVFSQKERALSRLRKVADSEIVSSYPQLVNLYKEWLNYSIICLKANSEDAKRQLKFEKVDKIFYKYMTALGILNTMGITDETKATMYEGDGRILYERSLQIAIENRISQIDRNLSQFMIGYNYVWRKEYAEAKKYYKDLFESDSYFAPEGGLYLAYCQQELGQKEESKKTLQQIIDIYPGYKDTLNKMLDKDIPELIFKL